MSVVIEDNKEIYNGETIFFSAKRGYGFLSWEKNGVKQKDLFIHFSDLKMSGFKTIKQGQKVEFQIGKNLRGQDKAIEVTPIV